MIRKAISQSAASQFRPGLESINTVIVFGQSNACGLGVPQSLPSALQGPLAGRYINGNQSNGIELMEAGVNTSIGVTFGHGVEVTLANDLQTSYGGEDVLIVKWCLGGTSLGEDNVNEPGFGYDWNPNTSELFSGRTHQPPRLPSQFFGSLFQKIDQTIMLLNEIGKKPNYLGAVWVQGEEDAQRIDPTHEHFDANFINGYGDAESLMATQLRQYLAKPSMPFISFLLPEFFVYSPGKDAVNAQKNSVVNTTKLPGGLTHKGDQVHYNSAAYQSMGSAAAALL
jgi:hypothetical protein